MSESGDVHAIVSQAGNNEINVQTLNKIGPSHIVFETTLARIDLKEMRKRGGGTLVDAKSGRYKLTKRMKCALQDAEYMAAVTLHANA